MKCFHFLSGEKKKDSKSSRSIPPLSYTTESTDGDMKRSGSEFTSQNESDFSAESFGRNRLPSLSEKPNNLKVFTFSELRTATKNFSRSLMLGEGGFGCVYRGAIKDPMDPRNKLDVAVKQLSRRGLQIIFRDFKTSNILLDKDWNAKLSDFGLARQGPGEGLSHVSTAVVGTIGYAAPEYIQTGRLTAKSDVWSYGVVLYELITGRKPIDRNRPKGEQKLLEWVKPYLSEKRFSMILDPRIQEQISLKSAQKLAAVANKCLVRQQKTRPKMSEILAIVKQIVESSTTGSPQPAIKILDSSEVSNEEHKNRSRLKRAISYLKMGGDGKRFDWWKFKSKLSKVKLWKAKDRANGF